MRTRSCENWKVLSGHFIKRFLNLTYAADAPGKLVKTGLLGPNPRVSDSRKAAVRPEKLHFYPSDTAATESSAGPTWGPGSDAPFQTPPAQLLEVRLL